jgi:hypothetical protein
MSKDNTPKYPGINGTTFTIEFSEDHYNNVKAKARKKGFSWAYRGTGKLSMRRRIEILMYNIRHFIG